MRELVVSECSLKLNNTPGFGITAGDNLEKAKYIAAIDALFHTNNNQFDDIKKAINTILEREKINAFNNGIKSFQMINKTRVDFETIEEQWNDE